jgi:hypothetical protein
MELITKLSGLTKAITYTIRVRRSNLLKSHDYLFFGNFGQVKGSKNIIVILSLMIFSQ